MGSARLPGKVLRPINGVPLLECITRRLSSLRHRARVVVATSTRPKDEELAEFCRQRGIACYRGSEEDVLERFFRCAQDHGFTQIVRLTADNPFTDVEELDRLIELQLATGSDLSHSYASLPVGVGAEVFTFEALQAAFREATAAHHREHVDEFLLERPERFRTSVLEVAAAKRRPDIRLTVDSEEDYRRACFVAERAGTPDVATEDAVRLCSQFA